MNHIQKMEEAAGRFQQMIQRIRQAPTYIATAVANGRMNPRLHAVCIAHAENWEALSHGFRDMQLEIDELADLLDEVIVPSETSDIVQISLDAIRVFFKAGIKVEVIVDVENPITPVLNYAIFQIGPHLHFAI
jgi:hypothetical protein